MYVILWEFNLVYLIYVKFKSLDKQSLVIVTEIMYPELKEPKNPN